MAVRATLISSGLLLIFALFGDDLLRVIGISLAGVRVGGGILLLLVSIDIVFGRSIGPSASRADEPHGDSNDVSAFPLATPIIAGPGADLGVRRSVVAVGALLDIGHIVVGIPLLERIARRTLQVLKRNIREQVEHLREHRGVGGGVQICEERAHVEHLGERIVE
jgi:small neutral amino acid transporter SnatA (MarC family)